jgi:membrane protein involved in colicin uptake
MAAVTAVATAAGAKFSANANNKATQAQQQSAAAALAYQKERDAAQRASSDAAYAEYRKQYDAWLNRFFPGYSVSGSSDSSPKGWSGTSNSVSARPMTAPGTPQPSYGPVAGATPLVPATDTATQPKTISDLTGWEDWKRYGVGA